MKCEGKTKAGKPCRNEAKQGEKLCAIHLGQQHPGRKLKLDDDLKERMIQLSRSGVANKIVAKAVGIGETTFYRWMEQGEADAQASFDSPYRELWEAMKKAEGEVEANMARVVLRAAIGAPAVFDDEGNRIRDEIRQNWTAAMTFLERKFPERWARLVKADVAQRTAPPRTADLEKLTDEQLADLEEILDTITAEGS